MDRKEADAIMIESLDEMFLKTDRRFIQLYTDTSGRWENYPEPNMIMPKDQMINLFNFMSSFYSDDDIGNEIDDPGCEYGYHIGNYYVATDVSGSDLEFFACEFKDKDKRRELEAELIVPELNKIFGRKKRGVKEIKLPLSVMSNYHFKKYDYIIQHMLKYGTPPGDESKTVVIGKYTVKELSDDGEWGKLQVTFK